MLPGPNIPSSRAATVSIAMFTHAEKALWIVLLACSLGSELIPLPPAIQAHFTYLGFYAYVAVKLLLFFIFGFVTQIAWWKYTALTAAEVVSILATAGVEIGQWFIPGHRASGVEFLVKLMLLFAGTLAGLNVRKYQNVHAGPLSISFTSQYW